MLSGLENPVHLLIILLIAMLVLGPKRLPGIGRSLGSGIREFRDSLGGGKGTDAASNVGAQTGDAPAEIGGEPAKAAGQTATGVATGASSESVGDKDKVAAEAKQ